MELESTVKSLYGYRIRQLILDTLDQLKTEGYRVRVSDYGALDHVVQARVEAAVRRLGDVPAPGVVPQARFPLNGSARDRLRRTRLYLPGNNPDLMTNAGLYGADCIILDLEDSVPPAEKEAARILVRNALRALDFNQAEKIVRINPLATTHGPCDLETIVPVGPQVLLIPKAESADDVSAVEEMLAFHEAQSGLPFHILLIPLIETARGVLNAKAIASASDRNVALCFGAEDFTADIGTERSAAGTESFLARSMILLAAKAAGLQALDTVHSDYEDIEGLKKSTREAIQLGFEGKGVIHPAQIIPIHQCFTPTPEQIDTAKGIIAALEQAQEKGTGVAAFGNKMIDAPVAARAKRILKLAKLETGTK